MFRTGWTVFAAVAAFGLFGAVAVAPEAAHALFLKKAVSQVKSAVKAKAQAVKSAVDAKVQAVKAALIPRERLLRKARESLADLMKHFVKRDGKTFYQWAPGEMVRVHEAATMAAAESSVPRSPYPSSVTERVPYYMNRDMSKAPPAKVDRRGMQSKVLQQGLRGTCTTHATVAALEAMNGKKRLSRAYGYWVINGKSAKEACKKDDGNAIKDAAAALVASPLPEPRYHLYNGLLPKVGGCIGTEPSRSAKEHAKVQATAWHETEDTKYTKNAEFIESVLAAGYDVVTDIEVAWKGQGKKIIDVTVDKKTGQALRNPDSRHAVLIVGYERTTDPNHGGGYFWFKNSWGKGWGKKGYGRMTYDYFRTYVQKNVFFSGLKKL